MQEVDLERFYSALNAMGTMFSDDMSPERQMLYWKLMSPLMTIEEWEQACHYALMHETFHKVPVPATLMECARKAKADAKHERAYALNPGLRGLYLFPEN
jgi:hypothetical protein